MELKEALEKGKGKARRAEWEFDFHITIATGDMISINSAMADDWLPYSPKPEKCRACQEADECAEDFMVTDHLRRYHCTCK